MPAPDWDIRLYSYVSGAFIRIPFPCNQVKSIEFDSSEYGGFGNGTVEFLEVWPTALLTGAEVCDIYIADDGGHLTPRYRGVVRVPQASLAASETRTLNLFGPSTSLNDVRVDRRYAYPVPVDVSVVATDLINDLLVNPGRVAPGLILDINTTGIELQTFDALDKAFPEAMGMLMDLSPGAAIWGFDLAPTTGVVRPANQVFVRARANTIGGPTNAYVFAEGGPVNSLIYPVDAGQIVNRVRIHGGKVSQPNLCTNGGFEQPAVPGEKDGNLVEDYSFEGSLEGSSASWFDIGSAGTGSSIKGGDDPGGGWPGAHEGYNWLSLDNPGEYASQYFGVDYSQPLTFSWWARRGDPTGAATMHAVIWGIDATGATVATFTSPDADPWLDQLSMSAVGDPRAYTQYTMTGDFHLSPTVVRVGIRLYGNSGTGNNDGVFVDNVAVYYTNQTAQTGWETAVSNPAGDPVPGIVDWTHRANPSDTTVPWADGYCVKAAAATLATGGYLEIRATEFVRAPMAQYKLYTMGCWVKAPSGSAFSCTVGAYRYYTAGTLNGLSAGTTESDTFAGPTDGSWNLLAWRIGGLNVEAAAQPFLRIYSAGVTVYADNFFVVEGPLPYEMSQYSVWWPGDSYERTIDVNWVGLGGLTAAAAASQSVYGIRERTVSQALVVDEPSTIYFGNGYFNGNAVPMVKGTLTLKPYRNKLGFDALYRVVNLQNPPPPLSASRISCTIGEDIEQVVELSNERPSLAALLLYGFSSSITGQAT